MHFLEKKNKNQSSKLPPRTIGKEDDIRSKVNRKKEIIKIRAGVNENESIKSVLKKST